MRLPYQKSIIVVCFALGLLCLSCINCSAQDLKKPLGALILASALDSVSTEIALQRPGIAEQNPIMGQSATQRVIVKAATTATAVWLVKRMGKNHPRYATVLSYTLSGVLGSVAVWNLQQGRQ